MPTYTFVCLEHDISQEENLKIDNRDTTFIPCPKCANRMIRAIDRPGLVWSPSRNGGHS